MINLSSTPLINGKSVLKTEKISRETEIRVFKLEMRPQKIITNQLFVYFYYSSVSSGGYERLRDNSKKDPGYETVQESSANNVIDNLPMGASAMRTSAEQLQLGARARAPPLPHHHHHHHHHHVHQHRHVNYSDFERSHFDPASIKPPPRVPNNTNTSVSGVGEEVGYETVPEVPPANDHEGYERVEDYWRGKIIMGIW